MATPHDTPSWCPYPDPEFAPASGAGVVDQAGESLGTVVEHPAVRRERLRAVALQAAIDQEVAAVAERLVRLPGECSEHWLRRGLSEVGYAWLCDGAAWDDEGDPERAARAYAWQIAVNRWGRELSRASEGA